MPEKTARNPRDPDATRRRIMAAAKAEFARGGLGGARVDVIAARARANKRMIYHYFGGKDELFRLVLEEAYAGIRAAEAKLELERLDALEALKLWVTFTWRYYLKNPEFIRLVNSENLHKARHLKSSRRIREVSRPFVGRMRDLLERGAGAGLFRRDLDAVQVAITIAAIGYYYLTNRHTGAIVYERDLMSERALAERQAFNVATVLRLVCTPETLKRIEEDK